MPHKEKATGKWGKSLTLTVGASEATEKDGDSVTLAVGLKTAKVEPAVHRAGEPGVEAKTDKNGVEIQEIEDSVPKPKEKEEDLLANELEPTSVVLLSISGYLNGIAVKFLIDSGASECFVDTAFTKKNGIKTTKRK